MKETFISLYNQGMMDSEIAKQLGVTDGAIFYWRKKLGLKTKFNYSKISKFIYIFNFSLYCRLFKI